MLTPEVIEVARQLRAQKMSWMMLASKLGVSEHKVRMAIDPDFVVYRRGINAKVRLDRLPLKRCPRASQNRYVPSNHTVESPNLRVPPDVLAERERRLAMAPPSLTAALLGDPLPGQREYLESLAKQRGA